MDDRGLSLDRMRTFVRVAQRGSLSATARELGIGQSTVTRHINELEEAVGVPLLGRTTRRVTLTEEGSRYYTNCLQILRLVEQASEEARDARRVPVGAVRVSCTAALGVMHVTRMIFAFQDRHPDVRIDLNLTDERIDLAREGVDIALRLGPVLDEAMMLVAIGASCRKLVGSPDYLSSHGRPSRPAELTHHAAPIGERPNLNAEGLPAPPPSRRSQELFPGQRPRVEAAAPFKIFLLAVIAVFDGISERMRRHYAPLPNNIMPFTG